MELRDLVLAYEPLSTCSKQEVLLTGMIISTSHKLDSSAELFTELEIILVPP